MFRRKLSPTHWVYLLINVIVVLLGTLMTKLNDKDPTFFAIGTAIIAAGAVGLAMFLYVRVAEESQRRLNMMQQFGFVDAFEKRGVAIAAEYNRLLEKSSRNIDVTGFGLSSLFEDYRDQFASWKEKADVRILLIDPGFPSRGHSFAGQREVEEGMVSGTIAKEVEQFVNFCRPLAGASGRGSFSVRLYRALPSVNIFRIDNHLFWGPYLDKKASRNTPTFLMERGILFDVLTDHFNKLWEDSVMPGP